MPEQANKPLIAYKRDAARLLKDARRGVEVALSRFSRLEKAPDIADLQLKHALAVVAREAGHPGWAALKQAVDSQKTGLDFSEFFASPSLRDSLNPWFNNYDEAKAHQLAFGGVLLPYRQHFFVSSLAMLTRLGYEADHPDWKDIGHDFVRPASEAAHSRIKVSLERRFAKP